VAGHPPPHDSWEEETWGWKKHRQGSC
jgi:hypothetical protein